MFRPPGSMSDRPGIGADRAGQVLAFPGRINEGLRDFRPGLPGATAGSLDRFTISASGRRASEPSSRLVRADIPVQFRRLEEQVDDLAVLAASAHAAAGPMADRGDALVRLSRRIWDSFQSLRIVPIQGLFQRLARVVHDAARVEGHRSRSS